MVFTGIYKHPSASNISLILLEDYMNTCKMRAMRNLWWYQS